MASKKSVCVAMSGGVDSSVVAAILKKRGYDVVGVTMQIWQESQKDPRHAGCCSLGAVEDARRVARILDIPHYVINYKDTFRETVIDEFVEEYEAGRTPNPCVTCNKKVKFGALLEKAEDLGCDSLATGHYARIRRDRATGRQRLLRARSATKDQSYVLYMLKQAQLQRLYFPLGELDGKAETRQMARELGLPVADKPESQEICFVSDAGGYREFLRKKRPQMFGEGEIVHQSGEVVGKHQGVAGYTVGQRRGIGVTLNDGKPLYVLSLEPKSNRVVVGDNQALNQNEVELTEVVWSGYEPSDTPLRVMAKIRYNMEPRSARLYAEPEPRIVFDEPVRAVTPGQIAVAYRGKTVVAGGKIL